MGVAGAGAELGVAVLAAGGGVTAPGTWSAAVGVTGLARSKTLPSEVGAVRKLPKYACAKVHTKKNAANTAVVRERKLAPPLAPNKLPDVPLPKAAPMSAPLPCCTNIKPIMPRADKI